MSLSFLSKKTWHTSNIQNVEKVWIAEQAHDREERKLRELQKQIDEERQIDELRNLQREAGHIDATSGTKKVEWMYEGPGSAVMAKEQADDYKLGRKYEAPAAFNQLHELEDKSTVGSKWIDNKANDTNEQFARLNADPLFAMRQAQKVERDKKVLANPIQMKRIKQKLASELKDLEGAASAKRDKKAAKEAKRAVKRAAKAAKKSKKTKKKKKHASSSSSDDSSDDDAGAADGKKAGGDTASSRKRKAEEFFDDEPAVVPGGGGSASRGGDRAPNNDNNHHYGLKKGKRTADGAALGPSASLLAAREREEARRGRVAPRRERLTEEEREARRLAMAADGQLRDTTRKDRMAGHETAGVKAAIDEDDAAKRRRALEEEDDGVKADPKFMRKMRNEVYMESNIDLSERMQRNKNRHQKSKNKDTFM